MASPVEDDDFLPCALCSARTIDGKYDPVRAVMKDSSTRVQYLPGATHRCRGW